MRRRRFSPGPFLFLLALAACARGVDPTPAPPSGAKEDVRRLAAILDYLAGDYAGAVKGGQIIDAGEHEEQAGFLRDAAALAARLPASRVDAVAGVAAVRALFERRADPPELAAAARTLRRDLLDAHGLVLAPTAPPSRARGAELYAQSCAACHGAGGGGDGPQAAQLVPKPRSFLDPEVMKDVSPARAFNALTDGIRGTAMPSWSALSTGDRWALAYHVVALRHDAAAARRGAAVAARADALRDPVALAGLSDAELEGKLAGLGPAERADAVAWLRREAAYAGEAPFAAARRHLARAAAAYRAGDRAAARDAVGQAYLDGFEPLEGALRARDGALVIRCEERFLALRAGISSGAPGATVEQEALQLEALLDRAEQTLAGSGGAGVAFAGALVVILREGVEAALLIMLLLGLARRAAAEPGAADGDARAVHAGWLGAALVGLATWFASEPIVRLGGARRELIEGAVAILAAVVLLATGHFVLARLDAQQRVQAIKRRLAAAPSGGRRRAVLAGLAFIAVYREAFEVVLFLRALTLDDAPGVAILGGVAAGALLLVGIVALLLKLGRRLKPGPLLATMGTLLCVLAVVLAGKGIRALQEAGVVSIRPLDLPRIDWLGLFPSLQGLAAQLTVLVLFAIIAATALRARKTA